MEKKTLAVATSEITEKEFSRVGRGQAVDGHVDLAGDPRAKAPVLGDRTNTRQARTSGGRAL
jgi:hypothetical protein